MICACTKRVAWEKVSAVFVRSEKKMEITTFNELVKALVKAARWLRRIEHFDALLATWQEFGLLPKRITTTGHQQIELDWTHRRCALTQMSLVNVCRAQFKSTSSFFFLSSVLLHSLLFCFVLISKKADKRQPLF